MKVLLEWIDKQVDVFDYCLAVLRGQREAMRKTGNDCVGLNVPHVEEACAYFMGIGDWNLNQPASASLPVITAQRVRKGAQRGAKEGGKEKR